MAIFSYISHEAGLIYGFHDAGLSEGDRGDIAVLPLVESVSGEKMVTVKLLPEELTLYAMADGWIYEFSYLSPDIPPYDHYGHTDWYEKNLQRIPAGEKPIRLFGLSFGDRFRA